MRWTWLVVLGACAAPADVPGDADSSASGPTAMEAVSGGYAPTGAGVAGSACSFTQGGWGSACAGQNVGCLRDAWFDVVFPTGLTVGGASGLVFASAADVEAYLPRGGPSLRMGGGAGFGQLVALELNLAFSNTGIFGSGSDLANATVTGGPYAGWTATDLAAYADTLGPAAISGSLGSALAAFNEGFESCDPAELLPVDEPDEDGDGVAADEDCDDADARVGALIASYTFSAADEGFYTSPTLDGEWTWGDGEVSVAGKGQNALLGPAAGWTDTVTFLSATARGSQAWCDDPGCEERFRLGVVARSTEDADQDEGFHGYRCAVATNTEYDCAEEGDFVQLAKFLDAEEDDVGAECYTGCPENTTFDELDRAPRSDGTDVLRGDPARLTFWTVGGDLTCVFDGEDGEEVTTHATDASFGSGGVALSVLNAQGVFDDVRVCEALSAP